MGPRFTSDKLWGESWPEAILCSAAQHYNRFGRLFGTLVAAWQVDELTALDGLFLYSRAMSEIPEHLKAEVEKWRSFRRERPQRIVTPGPGQESVWDYPRPPRVEPITKHIRIEFAGIVLADSRQLFRVIETAGPPVYYLPRQDIQMAYLEPSRQKALCEWKGISRYWSARVADRVAENVAWSYPEPWDGFRAIKDHLAFRAGPMDRCLVDGQLVTPQPGKYYGGWITPDIVGPFKGEPGSERW